MYKYVLLIPVFWGAILTLCAQESGSLKYPSFGDVPSLTIKLAPLNFLEPIYHTIEGAVEYKFDPRYAVQVQFGYGNSNFSVYNAEEAFDEQFETFRTRVEFRKYVSPFMGRLRDIHLDHLENSSYKKYLMDRRKRGFPYWAVELNWKNTTFFEEGFIGQNCVDNVCDFQQFGFYRLQKNLLAGHFKVGKQRFYGKHFILDYYLGIGLRFVHNRELDNPQDPFFFEDFFSRIDSREPGSFLMPSLSAGIKLGYSIPLKK